MIGLIFSRAYLGYVFPRLPLMAYLFSRAYHRVHVFPRLARVAYFCFEFSLAYCIIFGCFECSDGITFVLFHHSNKTTTSIVKLSFFFSNRKHRDHLLQSLLHLRIHAALQEIQHNGTARDRSPVLHEEEFAQNAPNREESEGNEDTAGSANDDDFFDAEEDCVPNLSRQESNSSFDIISDFADEV